MIISRRMIISALLGLFFSSPMPGLAHGFAQRYDLPVPLSLYISGAAATVAVSFIVIALFLRHNTEMYRSVRFNLLKVPGIALFAHPVLLFLIRLVSALLFVLVMVAGWKGVQEPFSNLAPTMVWVIWWVGLAYFCGLLGNLWELINPWKNTYDSVEKLIKIGNPERRLSFENRLANWVGVWPAVGLFLVFSWIELVWGESDVPASLATVAFAYSLITWTGMAVFGRDVWLRQGEAFTLVFSLLARFSPTEIRSDNLNPQWNLRPFGVGLLTDTPASMSLTVFVVLMLAAVTFDGFMATPLWAEIVRWALYADAMRPLLLMLQPIFGDAITVITSLGLVLFPTLFLAVFLLFCLLMRWTLGASDSLGLQALAGYFVLTLIPIALAYHLSHYLSFLLIVGQYMIPLASDPLGLGWDLFGTKHYFVNIGIINARFVWITSVIAIVVGHIFAVFLCHVMAQRLFHTWRRVLWSQLPMLVLMVGYTMVSLWILAQPIVE